MKQVLVLMLFAAFWVAGCGEDEGTDTSRSSDTSEKTAKMVEEGNEPRALGETVFVQAEDTLLQVRATKVLDPPPVGEFDEPFDAGSRFVGVEIDIKNEGDGQFTGFPGLASSLITDKDHEGTYATPSAGPCGGDFSLEVSISPGDSRRGCVAFEVPTGEKPELYQFRIEDGSIEGSDPAEWTLR